MQGESVLLVALLLASGLGTPGPAAGAQPSPAPLPASPIEAEVSTDPSPLPSVAPSPAESAGAIPADLFSQPPNPLTLTPVIDGERAVTKSIGPKGGTIKATGPDGTRFSLAIPRDDLLFETAITMTPVEDLTGFPTDATPAHHIGVQLEPDGLELAVPALLTIRPKKGFPTDGVVAMDYRHDGEEAGFHLAEQDVRQMTISVDHFSGYTAEFQLKVDEIRRLAEFNRRSPDDELSSQIAEWVALEKQKQIMGTTEGSETPDIDLVAGAKEFLPLYLEVVLSPKLAVAGRSCADAEAAMAAMLSYQRNRQLLGVGQDPAFDIQGGTTVPQQLLDLHTRLCLREAYQECTRTGDFPDLMGYVYRLFTRSRVLLGVEPTAQQIDLAHGYLRRCGRYRLELKQADIEHGSPPQHVIASSDIELEWQPGLWRVRPRGLHHRGRRRYRGGPRLP